MVISAHGTNNHPQAIMCGAQALLDKIMSLMVVHNMNEDLPTIAMTAKNEIKRSSYGQ